MKYSDFFSSNNLSAEDLKPGKKYPVTIIDIQPYELKDQRKPKPQAKLRYKGRELEKGWIINRTCGQVLLEEFGEPDNWVGKDVLLFSARTQFQGKPTRGIRVEVAPIVLSAKSDPTEQRDNDGLNGAGADLEEEDEYFGGDGDDDLS